MEKGTLPFTPPGACLKAGPSQVYDQLSVTRWGHSKSPLQPEAIEELSEVHRLSLQGQRDALSGYSSAQRDLLCRHEAAGPTPGSTRYAACELSSTMTMLERPQVRGGHPVTRTIKGRGRENKDNNTMLPSLCLLKEVGVEGRTRVRG